MNKVVNTYLKRVSAKLTCSRSIKSVYSDELKENILAYSKGKTDLTLEMLYEKFGAPDEIANGFYERSDYSSLMAKAKKKATRWMWIGIAVSVLLVITVIFIILLISLYGGDADVSGPLNIR